MPGSTDTTGSYNHYSALRSYEDLLGLTTGGADGQGHLGFAAATGLAPFGYDVFPKDRQLSSAPKPAHTPKPKHVAKPAGPATPVT